MRYRLYKPEDFAALYAIEEMCFQRPDRFSRSYMRRLVQQANSATWIAEDGIAEDEQRMCGFALVECAWGRTGVAAYIQTLEVVPQARGEGVGGQLLRCLQESAKDAGADAIWLHVDEANAAALRLYEAHGYKLEGRQENYYGRDRAALIYAKPLDLERA